MQLLVSKKAGSQLLVHIVSAVCHWVILYDWLGVCFDANSLRCILLLSLQAAAKAVLAMQQKPPDPPGAGLSSAPAAGQDREAALVLSGEEAFARRAMYALLFESVCI